LPDSRFYRAGSPADSLTRPLGSLVGKVVQEKQRLRRALKAERDDDPTAGRQLIGSHTGAPTLRQNKAKVPPEGVETPSPGATEFAYALKILEQDAPGDQRRIAKSLGVPVEDGSLG
jgi:hypothetical protein